MEKLMLLVANVAELRLPGEPEKPKRSELALAV
jgi:hypothetical protein